VENWRKKTLQVEKLVAGGYCTLLELRLTKHCDFDHTSSHIEACWPSETNTRYLVFLGGRDSGTVLD
jgi:hypothetical protein